MLELKVKKIFMKTFPIHHKFYSNSASFLSLFPSIQRENSEYPTEKNYNILFWWYDARREESRKKIKIKNGTRNFFNLRVNGSHSEYELK